MPEVFRSSGGLPVVCTWNAACGTRDGGPNMAPTNRRHTADPVQKRGAREAADETIGEGGGGRGGRSRGTASRSAARTTSESRGEVERAAGNSRSSHAAPKGKGSKPEAPRGRKGQTSGKGSTGARKSVNRPGPSGTGSKKGTRGSSGRRRSGSRSGGGTGSKKG
jgi:hypothetical protein